ncbi:unnamed protein product [Caenorhabditis bovis]|uniref:Protein kinase domain-containing protein n=1 Tax=Caenorhabditis bovis TaxID=2654633 RepID=A0A8S1EI54_9PELO|nr:unnamed protein product [Caenorhabditis bovis]
MLTAFVLLTLCNLTAANLLMPGIYDETIEVQEGKYQLIGVPQAALNGTYVQLEFSCDPEVDLQFEVEYVLRSSPCDKEFFNTHEQQKRQNLQFYFNESNYNRIPDTFDYQQIVYYKSPSQLVSCKENQGRFLFPNASSPMTFQNVTRVHLGRVKRSALATFHPTQSIPLDGIYFMIIKITGKKFPQDEFANKNVTISVQWKAPYGFLSAIDWPLLRFYKVMCVFYSTLALIWLYLCIKYYRDILRIQYWIGVVIILGMIEKAFFLSEYSSMNDSGKSLDGIIEAAEIVSCAKKTMSRVLVIIVSVGYGVVKPRLGATLNQVAGVGLVYFIFCSIEGIARVSKNSVEATKQKQFAALPLVITEMIIFYWIFTSLTATIRMLRLKRNEIKLNVYRHFTNTLVFAVLSSVVFMIWSMIYHILPTCRVDWKELWVDTAFWHVLFCIILVVIMILWRPSQNNQRYAFTPLLDDSEDENDQDELFNAFSPGYDLLTVRNSGAGAENRRQREAEKEQERKDDAIKEDLKWIEENIPTTIADTLLGGLEDPEELESRQLEVHIKISETRHSALCCVRTTEVSDSNNTSDTYTTYDEDSAQTSNTQILEWLLDPKPGQRMLHLKQMINCQEIQCKEILDGESTCTSHFLCGEEVNIRGQNMVIVERLGTGSYGTVYKFFNEAKQNFFAAKMFQVRDFEGFVAEYSKLRLLNSYAKKAKKTNIVHLLDYFVLNLHCFMSMEYLPFSYTIVRKNWNLLDVFIIRRLLFQLIDGIVFYSSYPFFLVHADLKSRNVMLRGTCFENFQVVIVDFGMANMAHTFTHHHIQTLGYRAPEVAFRFPFYTNIDMFSFGIMALETYCGGNIFAAKNETESIAFMEHVLGPFTFFRERCPDKLFLRKLNNSAMRIPPSLTLKEIFQIYVPEEEEKREAEVQLYDLIAKSLEVDPMARLTPKDAYNHPFFAPLRNV